MHTRPALVLAIFASLLACKPQSQTRVAVAEDAASDDDPGLMKLQFAWPPGRLKVIEKVHKKGVDAVMSYTLDVHETSDGLVVEYLDFRFESYAGLDRQDPAIEAQLAKAEQSARVMQLGFRVRSDGEFLGLLDMDSLVRGIEALAGPEEAALARKMLGDPQARNVLEAAASKPWESWVGIWLELEAEPGGVLEAEGEVEFGGVPIRQQVRYEYLGEDPFRPGHVSLRFLSHIDDPRLLTVLGDLATTLVDDDPVEVARIRAGANHAASEFQFSHDRTIDISLIPGTMVPAWVKDVVRTSVSGGEAGSEVEARERLESHEWTFEPVGG